MTHSAENDVPLAEQIRRELVCGCIEANDGLVHPFCRGAELAARLVESVLPPAKRDDGLPFAPPENEEPTGPTCGQALFTHGIVGRCIPPGGPDA